VPDHADNLPMNSRPTGLRRKHDSRHWTVNGVASSVHLRRQVADFSEKLHWQLMYAIQKETGEQWHASSDKPIHSICTSLSLSYTPSQCSSWCITLVTPALNCGCRWPQEQRRSALVLKTLSEDRLLSSNLSIENNKNILVCVKYYMHYVGGSGIWWPKHMVTSCRPC